VSLRNTEFQLNVRLTARRLDNQAATCFTRFDAGLRELHAMCVIGRSRPPPAPPQCASVSTHSSRFPTICPSPALRRHNIAYPHIDVTPTLRSAHLDQSRFPALAIPSWTQMVISRRTLQGRRSASSVNTVHVYLPDSSTCSDMNESVSILHVC
jgi:hypothetical protein